MILNKCVIVQKNIKLDMKNKKTGRQHENITDNFKNVLAVCAKKLENTKKAGINPYPSKTNRDYSCKEIKSDFEKLAVAGKLSIAGRIVSVRKHGGSAFVDIEDGTGKFQIYFKKDEIKNGNYDFFIDNFSRGDFVEINGVLFITKRGEKSMIANSYKLLCKALIPVPEKWYGLKDFESRLRQRYLDLMVNPEIRELFVAKSRFIDSFRNCLKKNGFLETETPVLENIPGGAEAEPFITHHNTLNIDLYLRISLELHLKRLIVGGFDKVFEIGKVFRNEGMSREHLQEFTLLEFYRAYWDYNQLMDFVESMYKKIALEVFGKSEFEYEGIKLNFNQEWKRIKYRDVFEQYLGIDLGGIKTRDDIVKEIKKRGIKIEIDKKAGLGRIVDQVYKKFVRPELTGPLFLTDHPISISPLAKEKIDDPGFVERFQVLIMGSELGNGFSELNDPAEQEKRFREQMNLREAGDKEAQMMDEDFIEALKYGMPPTAGFGVGLDRLFMILSGVSSVRETVLFPTMRPDF